MAFVAFRADILQATKYLTALQRREIPYATSRALNDTAFEVRRTTITLWSKSFEVKNPTFARALFRVRKASKTQLISTVYQALDRDYVGIQIEGGIRTPHSGQNLAIPESRNNPKGRRGVAAAKRPRNLVNSFRAEVKGRGEGIWQRFGRGQRSIRLMYVLKRSVVNRARFPFYTDGAQVARRVFARYLDAALKWAIANAKP